MDRKSRYSRESRKRINSLILLICFTIILAITATYAWFSTQKNVSVNNLKGKVEVAEELKISLDADIWDQSISFGTTNSSNLGKQTSNGIIASWDQFDLGIQTSSSPYLYNNTNYVTNNTRPILNTTSTSTFVRGSSGNDSTTGYLIPISSAGTLTSDSKKIKFFQGTFKGSSLKKIKQADETNETGIYAFDVYLMNTTKGNNPDQLYLNYDSIVREIKKDVSSTDYGLKNSVRVGFAFYDGEVGISSTKDEILEGTNNSIINKVAIWEPNYDTHSEYSMQQNDKLKEITGGVSNNATAIESLYIGDIPENNKIVDVYTTDSTTTGLKTYSSIKTKGQIVTAKLNEEDVSANASGIQKITDVDGNDIKLTANKISKLRVYIWLEGQDPDCINWASHSEGIDINIGLAKASSGKELTVGSLELNDGVPIEEISVTGVSLNKETTTIGNGESETLVATIEPSDASNKNVTWTSSDESVAIVDQDGTVTATNSSGTATITVTTEDGNFTASCTVTAETCFAKGTQITMSDGSIKNIEDITKGDSVLTFNHELGVYETQEVYFVWKGADTGKAFTLDFDNGESVSIVGKHDLFEKESLKYVSISKNDAESFVGKHFYSVNDGKYVKLISVTNELEDTEYYSIYTKYTKNCIANGMLSVPADDDQFLNIYEFNEDLSIDHEKLEQDIKKYGIYEYNEKLGYTKEEHEFINIRYIKIAVGKGLISWEDLLKVSEQYFNY